MAYDALVEKEIPVPRAKVFANLMDFGGVKKLLPDAVTSCDCIGEGVGAERTIVLGDGGRIVERLEVAHDDALFAYSILENNALPVTNYFAAVTLSDTAKGTHVSWGSNWKPQGEASDDEVREALEGLYTALIDGIAKNA
ncbi:MAG: SRPBCC family protein [Gammaproteobacteria bacterium]